MHITRRAKSITALSLSVVLLLGGAASATLGQAAPSPVSSIVISDAEAKSAAAQAIAAAGEAHATAVDASRKAVADEAAAKVKAEEEAAAQAEAELEAQQAADAEHAAQVAAEEALAVAAPEPAPVSQAPVQAAALAPIDANAPVWTAGTGIWAGAGAASDGAIWQIAIDARVGWASTKFDNIVLTRSHLNDAGAPMLSVQVGQVINFDGVLYRITGDAYGDMNAVSAWQNLQAHAPGTDILIQTCTDWNEPNTANPQERAIVGTRI